MAKKNNKRKRKRKPLKADPKRQATDSLRGYRYQILHSVNAWLDLAEGEILYLEGVEDFDILSDDTATVVQVKDTQRNITLKSQEVLKAINHYWESRTNHPNLIMRFRFITRSKIGKEQGNPFGNDQQGLRSWNRCSGDEEIITKISGFLQTQETISDEVKDFLKQSVPQQIYEQLIEPITWETDSKDASSVERSISDKVLLVGKQYFIAIPPHDTKKVVDSLLTKALTVATQKENRELTQMHFLKIFYEKAMQNVPNWYPQHLQMLEKQATALDTANAAFIGGTSDVTIQSQSPIQDTIPGLYPNVIRRTDLLTSIQTKLQSDGITVIQGGVDKGKTTLAQLTANDIDNDWFWLKFTNKDAPQVVQDLQQLDIAINNRSSQVNVVFDDLNLQAQELQKYEGDLCVVVRRVLERGAKLLITSQYNPPNNFIRSLGLSSSVVVHVPNFTISEIEQLATEMGCPAEDAKDLAELFQLPTKRHPRLVHALFTQLRKKDWEQQDIIESIFHGSSTMAKELEDARQLLTDLSEDQREFLYRLSLTVTEFRKDCALNIGEIPKPISHPGHTFSQLVGPWIDQVSENYYTISPLLTDAAKEIWSDENKIKDLHAHIANAILKTKNLTTTEAWAVFTHSMVGQSRGGLISVIHALMTVPQSDWENLCQEFSLLAHVKTEPPEELFPGETFVNYFFRSLQYRIAVEVDPEFAPKILEIWDKETKRYEPHQSYLLSRVMLASQVLRYNQVQLPAKKLVAHLKEMIDIKNRDEEVWETYLNSMGQLEKYNTDKSNFFSFLFSFVYVRHDINAAFLNDLIDALDELEPENRTLLLADFEDDSIESKLLIDSVWWTEANLEKPGWAICLEVFDKVIEKTLAWGYPHIAALSARGKAIIHDEYLEDADTAHQVLQDISLKIGALPSVEEEQALVYLHQKRYKEALDIYERILPQWNPPSEQLDIGPLEEYRRAAICAAYLDDWKKAACFFEEGANKTQKIENTERYIGLYADAGFAQFKAGNMLDSIKLLNLALQKLDILPQDNTDLKYFTLKKRLVAAIQWMAKDRNADNSSELEEPSVGFCSNPDTDEKVLNLPDSPIGYAWLYLAQIEYKFGDGTRILEHALQIKDRNVYPALNFFLSRLEAQYDFRNKSFEDLPQRMNQLADAYGSTQHHYQTGKGIVEKGIYSISIDDLSNFASVKNITGMLVAALLVQLPIGIDTHKILAIWRANSSELPIKENMSSALDLIESTLSGNRNNALTAMRIQDAKVEKQLVAALKVIYNVETSLENLFTAHTFITIPLIGSPWKDFIEVDLAELLSAQWLEKLKDGAMSQMHVDIVQQIEKACNSSYTGKKKIGQILLAVYLVVSTMVAPGTLQQLRNWAESESEQKQEPTTGKNLIAQRLIEVIEKPPHLTHEDVDALHQSIEEGKIPIKFDSPFEPDEHEKE